MKIVARSEDRYLVDIGKGYGRVLDRNTGVFYRPFLLASLAARGYWEPYTGPQGALARWLEDVTREPDEPLEV